MKKVLRFATVVVLLMSFSSCDPEKPMDNLTYSDLFEQTADNIIIPSYAQFQSDLSALRADFDVFDASEVQSLEKLQDQFKATYLSWQSVSAFDFGPAADYSTLLLMNCNSFPTNVSKIEDNIQSGSFDLDVPSNYEAKGLPALDYLLFHTSQIELLTELSDSSRINYISACIVDMQTRVEGVVEAWDSYRAVFVQANGNDRSSSLSLLFNTFLYDYEQVKRNKFALPSGFATQYGIPIAADNSVVEGRFSEMSFELMDANLAAWVFSLYRTQWATWVQSKFQGINYILESLYGFDRFNEIVFVGGIKKLGNFLWKVSDAGLIDKMVVNGSAIMVGFIGSVVRPIQTGYVYHYAFFMIFSLLVILTWVLFAGDNPLLQIEF